MLVTQTNGYSVLILEEQETIRIATSTMLQLEGFTTIGSASPMESLAILQTVQLDAILTDVSTQSAVDGLSLASEVESKWPHMAILLASTGCTVVKSPLPASARYVRKPYDRNELTLTLREALILKGNVRPPAHDERSHSQERDEKQHRGAGSAAMDDQNEKARAKIFMRNSNNFVERAFNKSRRFKRPTALPFTPLK